VQYFFNTSVLQLCSVKFRGSLRLASRLCGLANLTRPLLGADHTAAKREYQLLLEFMVNLNQILLGSLIKFLRKFKGSGKTQTRLRTHPYHEY
jgi:hypothetical protein